MYRVADLPTLEQQEKLLLPEQGQELTTSQQVRLLETNVKEWNRWYASQAENANLQYADLHGAYLQDAYLHGANLLDANLQGALYNRRYTRFPEGFDPTVAGMVTD